jgi:hypothetical protein
VLQRMTRDVMLEPVRRIVSPMLCRPIPRLAPMGSLRRSTPR